MNKNLLLFTAMTMLFCGIRNSNAQTPTNKKENVEETTTVDDLILSLEEMLMHPAVQKTPIFIPSNDKEEKNMGYQKAATVFFIPLPEDIDMLYYQPVPDQEGAYLYNSDLSKEDFEKVGNIQVETLTNKKLKKKFNQILEDGDVPVVIKNSETGNYELTSKEKDIITKVQYRLNMALILYAQEKEQAEKNQLKNKMQP